MLRTHDLADVVYASGAVFNGLATSRLDTLDFLVTGSTAGVTSKADLALLEDLRDAAAFVVHHTAAPIDADYVVAVNARLSRSAALHPGRLRRDTDRVGVSTRYGRHEPGPLTEAALQDLIDSTVTPDHDHADNAIALFVALAATQPFGDGNKRTALFVANGYLIHHAAGQLLTLPVGDEDDPLGAGRDDVTRFNDLLARAYVFGETTGVETFLRHYVVPLPSVVT